MLLERLQGAPQPPRIPQEQQRLHVAQGPQVGGGHAASAQAPQQRLRGGQEGGVRALGDTYTKAGPGDALALSFRPRRMAPTRRPRGEQGPEATEQSPQETRTPPLRELGSAPGPAGRQPPRHWPPRGDRAGRRPCRRSGLGAARRRGTGAPLPPEDGVSSPVTVHAPPAAGSCIGPACSS